MNNDILAFFPIKTNYLFDYIIRLFRFSSTIFRLFNNIMLNIFLYKTGIILGTFLGKGRLFMGKKSGVCMKKVIYFLLNSAEHCKER